MEDLFQQQITESCKLALPDGLKDLMADITREVLRVQPNDLHKFITDYLSALLVIREHLSVASRICDDVCDNICHPILVDELRDIVFEDAEEAAQIIINYLANGKVKEETVMRKLINKINIEEHQLPAIQNAVRNAFLRQKLENQPETLNQSSQSACVDDVTRAVQHTIKLYSQTEPTPNQKYQMATKIQAAYKSYGVRRQEEAINLSLKSQTTDKSQSISKRIKFNEAGVPASRYIGMKTASSTSLAGSYLHLPLFKPYSISELCIYEDFQEDNEKEHSSIDYTSNDHYIKADLKWKKLHESGKFKATKKRISFHNKTDRFEFVEDNEGDADDETNDSIMDESGTSKCDHNKEGADTNVIRSNTSDHTEYESLKTEYIDEQNHDDKDY